MNLQPINRVVLTSFNPRISEVENFNKNEDLRKLLANSGYAYNAIKNQDRDPMFVVKLKDDGHIQEQLTRLLNFAIAFEQDEIFYLDTQNELLKILSDGTEERLGKLKQVGHGEEYLFSQYNLNNNVELHYGLETQIKCDTIKDGNEESNDV